MKYKRKPAVVEAFRFNADVEITAPEWFVKELEKEKYSLTEAYWTERYIFTDVRSMRNPGR